MFTAAAVPIIDCISKIMSDFNSLFVCQIEKGKRRERDWVREREREKWTEINGLWMSDAKKYSKHISSQSRYVAGRLSKE